MFIYPLYLIIYTLVRSIEENRQYLFCCTNNVTVKFTILFAEHGFSVNKKVLTVDQTRLNPASVNASHIVRDQMEKYGYNVATVPITKGLLCSVCTASAKLALH